MPGHKRLLKGFLLQLLLLVPSAYLFWYAFGPLFVWPVAHMSNFLAHWLLPEYIQAVSQNGVQLAVYTGPKAGLLASHYPDGSVVLEGRGIHVYAAPLGAGLPLFLALSMAMDCGFKGHLWRLALGLLLVFVGQSASVLFKLAVDLDVGADPDAALRWLCDAACAARALFYAHYVTYMVTPVLLPVLVWLLLYLRSVQDLLPGFSSRLAGGGYGEA